MRVLLFCHATQALGAGHLVRCTALAQTLLDRGHSVVQCGAVEIPWAQTLLAVNGVRRAAPPGFSPEQVAELAVALQADWLVLDAPELDPAFLDVLRRQAPARLLVLDDEGRKPVHAHLVLNQNPGAANVAGAYRGTVLLGPSHVLLRRSVRQLVHHTAPANGPVLVMAGGTDPAAVGGRLLDAALAAPGVAVLSLLAGAPVDHPRVEALGPLVDPAAAMARAGMCLTAAGSTCWELAACGVPMAVTVVAQNQALASRALVEAGAALALPPAHAWHQGLARDTASRLAGDPALRTALSRAARALVDGQGNDRVVDAMEQS